MLIGIPLSKSAYTPEAYAYESYLIKMGHQVQLDYELDPNNDVNIYFMGTRPFWKKKEGSAIEIHEYQSLSTPPYAYFKNFTKKFMNKVPDGRIFLNSIVHKGLNFNDDIPYIYRDMGVDEILFQTPSDSPLYDIVYSGSISGRIGLIDVLLKLAQNYKVVVVGKVTQQEQKLLEVKNITLLGQVGRSQLPEIYRNARFGLNYTPNIYPFNIQTSTKTLEYLASGLRVISNRYNWIEVFERLHNLGIIWLDQDICNIQFDGFNKGCEMNGYSWDNVLNNSGFLKFLESYV